jgi:hypothetical protein
MTYGLLLLNSKSEKNNKLSKNPEITFFKKVFVKHTNFSQETLPLYFSSNPDFGKKLTINISKIGDLLSHITLKITLPSIPLSSHSSLPNTVKKFRWINKIAFGMIKNIDLEIGGILIDKHYGDWLNVYYEIFDSYDTHSNKLLGNLNEDLISYTEGKDKYNIYLPLKFFFNLESKLTLPLLSITSQSIKINIEFNNFKNCYLESPTNYFNIDSHICLFQKDEYICQTINNVKNIGRFVYFDIENKRVYYDKIKGNFQVPTNSTNISNFNIIGEISKFNLIPIPNSIIYKDENYFLNKNLPTIVDASMLVNYIFLDHTEKWNFKTNKQIYIVPLIGNVLDKTVTNPNTKYTVKLNHPNKMLLWRAVLQNNINLNDQFNYSTFPLTNKYDNIIESTTIYINNNDINNIHNSEFYNYLQNYVNKFSDGKHVSVYSFSVESDNLEPNGTMNFSKIQDLYLQLRLNKNVSYQNPVNVRLYGIQFNILEVENGICSLKYSI